MSAAEQYAPGVSDIGERAGGFSGREWVFERIHDWLKNPAGGRFYLLTAEPGAGKTAIAARLVQFSQGLANPPASCPLFQPGFVYNLPGVIPDLPPCLCRPASGA